MKTRTIVELPGYVTVAVAAERLHLAPRTVRGLVYAGRLPSARLGRRHFLRVPDVETERRRRLGLPLPTARNATRRTSRRAAEPRASQVLRHGPVGVASSDGAVRAIRSEVRRERAAERAAQLERWLRNHGPAAPALPFRVVDVTAAAACDACHKPVRAGGRMVDAAPAEGRAARLCLTCARRTILAWSDARRRESAAARSLAGELGTTYAPLLEPTTELAEAS